MNPQLPVDFTNRMKEQLGDEYDAFISSYDAPPVRSLRINRRKVSSVDYAHMSSIFTGESSPEAVSFCEGAYYYADHEPGRSPLHDAGAYYIQEASAMLPAQLLDISERGLKVLDLCSAPGGKMTQIADLMNGHGLLVANEIIASRASVLSENAERLGVENALVLNHEPAELAGRFPSFFDRILVDAPCSGEGLFRRWPEATGEWSLDNVKMCAARQDDILDFAAAMLAPNGKIVYSTCTFSPEEDKGTTERFLSRHSEFEICDEPVHLYPHTAKCEGHFAVSFTRKNMSPPSSSTISPTSDKSLHSRKKPVLSPAETSLIRSFLDECLKPESPHRSLIEGNLDRIIRFGDSIYFAPEFLPDISHLKVKRCGLKIGTFQKNRFEPDHALSHALSPEEAAHVIDLPQDSNEVRQYISGMTINCDKEMKGWCLVCTEKFGLGWGKASGGTLKNHYPKGLRR